MDKLLRLLLCQLYLSSTQLHQLHLDAASHIQHTLLYLSTRGIISSFQTHIRNKDLEHAIDFLCSVSRGLRSESKALLAMQTACTVPRYIAGPSPTPSRLCLGSDIEFGPVGVKHLDMLTDKEIEDAAYQLRHYRQNDTLTNILDNYEDLLERYRLLKSDFEEEKSARERYKQQAKRQERNPFVLVLVDGDGYVFKDSLISQGAEGGSQAAQLLNNSIKARLRQKNLEHCDTMVRVYANVTGLSKALSKAGLIGAEKRSLAPFIADFNRQYPLSDFVDAGEFKENADFKLRGLLRLYAENAQCKHIFFVACHDAGYVSELTQYRGQNDRFTLITTPGLYFHDEFTKLGLNIEELPGVFRHNGSALDAFYPKPPQTAAAVAATKSMTVGSSVAPSSPATAKSQLLGSSSEICSFYKIGKCRYGNHCKNAHPRDTNPRLSQDWRSENGTADQNSNGFGSPLRVPVSRETTHHSKIKPLQQVDFISLLPRNGDIPNGHVPVNKYNQRLDAYLKPIALEAEARLKARTTDQRLCNAMHLTGACNNPHCEYDHNHLDDGLKPALEWLSRSLPCPKRGSCRNATCTFGHVCQKADCKFRGGRTFCKLGSLLHFDDLEVDRYVPASWTRPQTAGFSSEDRQSPGSPSPLSEAEEDNSIEVVGGTSLMD